MQKTGIEDFEVFKKQFDMAEIIDKMIIKREYFIPERAMDIKEFYDLDANPIGEGTYGKVYLGTNRRTSTRRAIKLISRKKIRRFDRFINEVNALKTLDHPNVIRLFEIYQDKENVYLVQELCKGGELFDDIADQGYYSEKKAADVFRQILQALIYTHKNNICHRDLKPENFLYIDETKKTLKIIDFGLSIAFLEQIQMSDGKSKIKMTKLKTCAGTSLYMAPEVIKRSYSYSCDLWSAGVILYIMLSGTPPFWGDDDQEVFERVLEYSYDFDDEIWDNISAEAKDLISKLLCHHKKRISAQDALHHPWMEMNNMITRKDSRLDLKQAGMLQKMSTFGSVNKMQQVAMHILAHQCESGEIDNSRKIFQQLDVNNDGYITLKELQEGLSGLKTQEEVEQILRAVDTDKNGAINYTEFIAATISSSVLRNTQNIKNAFHIIDKDGNGYIDRQEVAQIVGTTLDGKQDENLISQLINEADENGDEKISLDEFVKMITKITMIKHFDSKDGQFK